MSGSNLTPSVDLAARSRYQISRGSETTLRGDSNQLLYRFCITVTDTQTGQVTEFSATDADNIQAGFRAVDEMLAWLKNAPE